MRSKVVRMLALAMLLCGVGVGLAQQPQKKARIEEEEQDIPRAKQKAPQAKSKLEEMLAEALKHNPDIRVAEAKLAMAEAELTRTRAEVPQKVVTLYHAILSQKATVDYTQKQYDRLKGLLEQKAIDSKLVDEMLPQLTAAKAKLDELEAQMPALLGKTARAEGDAGSQEFTVRHALVWLAQQEDLEVRRQALAALQSLYPPKATGPLAERMRKALQTPIKVDYKNTTFREIFKDLEKKAPGLSLRDFPQADNFDATLHFEEALPVSAILQALADDSGVRFVVRDYGIRVITLSKTPAPPGALSIEEFLRQKPAEQPRSQPASGKNPPKENVEGLVKSVDASGLMRITIGSDAGLARGHTLDLFRLNAASPTQSKYLGTVRILEADAHQAVAQPVGRLAAPAQKGDRAVSRLGQ